MISRMGHPIPSDKAVTSDSLDNNDNSNAHSSVSIDQPQLCS